MPTNQEWLEYYRFHPSEFESLIAFAEKAVIERDSYKETLESIDALLKEDMGEWYGVEFGHLPIALANRAHIRDAIKAAFECDCMYSNGRHDPLCKSQA